MEATEGEMPEGVPRPPWRGRKQRVALEASYFAAKLAERAHAARRLYRSGAKN